MDVLIKSEDFELEDLITIINNSNVFLYKKSRYKKAKAKIEDGKIIIENIYD